MNPGRWNEWLALVANLSVVIGLVFLAFEIRENTASNRIALQSQFSANWVDINGDVATDRELATIIDKAIRGEELDSIDRIQLVHFIQQRSSQAALMRRLYEEGFATREDVHRAYNGLKSWAVYDTFRKLYEDRLSERNQRMVFEEDGVDWWLDAIDSGQVVD